MWTLRKGVQELRAELRDEGVNGIVMEIYNYEGILTGMRFVSRDLAIRAARVSPPTIRARRVD